MRRETGDRYQHIYSSKKNGREFVYKYGSVAQFFDGVNFFPLKCGAKIKCVGAAVAVSDPDPGSGNPPNKSGSGYGSKEKPSHKIQFFTILWKKTFLLTDLEQQLYIKLAKVPRGQLRSHKSCKVPRGWLRAQEVS